MTHAVPVSDETFRAIEALAREPGTSPEALAETLLREHVAQRLALLRQNAEWDAGLAAALARATHGETPRYANSDALFAALDEAASEGTKKYGRPMKQTQNSFAIGVASPLPNGGASGWR